MRIAECRPNARCGAISVTTCGAALLLTGIIGLLYGAKAKSISWHWSVRALAVGGGLTLIGGCWLRTQRIIARIAADEPAPSQPIQPIQQANPEIAALQQQVFELVRRRQEMQGEATSLEMMPKHIKGEQPDANEQIIIEALRRAGKTVVIVTPTPGEPGATVEELRTRIELEQRLMSNEQRAFRAALWDSLDHLKDRVTESVSSLSPLNLAQHYQRRAKTDLEQRRAAALVRICQELEAWTAAQQALVDAEESQQSPLASPSSDRVAPSAAPIPSQAPSNDDLNSWTSHVQSLVQHRRALVAERQPIGLPAVPMPEFEPLPSTLTALRERAAIENGQLSQEKMAFRNALWAACDHLKGEASPSMPALQLAIHIFDQARTVQDQILATALVKICRETADFIEQLQTRADGSEAQPAQRAQQPNSQPAGAALDTSQQREMAELEERIRVAEQAQNTILANRARITGTGSVITDRRALAADLEGRRAQAISEEQRLATMDRQWQIDLFNRLLRHLPADFDMQGTARTGAAVIQCVDRRQRDIAFAIQQAVPESEKPAGLALYARMSQKR
jgi:hypothetical protein